jgi:hypothetical protein
MEIAATLTAQYQRIATHAAASAQYPALAAYASRSYADLTTIREIGNGDDEAAYKPAFRHANNISAACNETRSAIRDAQARKVLGALDSAASLWVTALNHHLDGKVAHAEFTLTLVENALADYDRLAGAVRR